jgi:hypothetical protein
MKLTYLNEHGQARRGMKIISVIISLIACSMVLDLQVNRHIIRRSPCLPDSRNKRNADQQTRKCNRDMILANTFSRIVYNERFFKSYIIELV